jgi:conjugative relaxase-like TrwC/TraI family protein
MLSVSNVSAGAAASGYYQAEGYYIAGTPEAEAAARWHGKAVDQLVSEGRAEFSGAIDDSRFAALLEGWAPNLEKDKYGRWKDDTLLGRWVDGERQHRAGLDLTFSASKSVSIMALVAGDDRILAAHDAAVRSAVSYVETAMVTTRRQGNTGEIEVVEGGKIIAGLFRHDTSRALDPQLHSHAVIANMVLNPDGKWTALRNDDIFRGKMLAGEIYRNVLARNLHDLGYTVERRGRDGIVEIAGVSDALIAAFSKRSSAIDASLAARGLDDSPENRALAALATRVTKNGNLDRAPLHGEWAREAQDAGQSLPILEALKEGAVLARRFRVEGVTRADGSPVHRQDEARTALAFAITHLSERQSVYSQSDLLKTALPRLQKSGVEELNLAVRAELTSSRLLNAGKVGRDPIFTDKETLSIEREVIAAYRQSARATRIDLPRYNDGERSASASIRQQLTRTALTEGQRDAVVTALTGSSRFVGVQGSAGTGKTFMVETLKRYGERAGYGFDGLAPSGRAVAALNEALPGATTLQSWLTQIRAGNNPGAEDNTRRILVIDEAGMISARDMRDLMQFTNRVGYARVVLIGDTKQLDAVEAGQPFQQLQKAGMPTAIMADIQRQRTDEGREAVLHAIRGEVREAFCKIGAVEETRLPLSEAIAANWLSLRPADRTGTGIVVLTNAARQAVNAEIREGLKREFVLSPNDVTLHQLVPQGFTRAEAADARSYQPGDIIVPAADSKQAGLLKNRDYGVLEVDSKAGKIVVADRTNGETKELQLRQDSRIVGSLRVFREETRDFTEGDQVRFTIADKRLGLINGARGTVDAIGDGAVSVRLSDGRNLDLARDSLALRGMDHAYAATAHDFQGATVNRILIGMSASEQLVSQKSFYVAISRMRDEAVLLTNDASGLARRIEEQTGERPTALESWLKAERDARAQASKIKDQAKEERAPSADDVRREETLRTGASKEPDSGPLTAKELDLLRSTVGSDRSAAESLTLRQRQKTMEGPVR